MAQKTNRHQNWDWRCAISHYGVDVCPYSKCLLRNLSLANHPQDLQCFTHIHLHIHDVLMSPLPIKYFDPMAIRKGFLGNSKSPQIMKDLSGFYHVFTICLSSMFLSQHIPRFISTHLFFVIHETPCLSYRGFKPPKRSCPPRWCLLPLQPWASETGLEIPRMSGTRPGLLGTFLDARPTRPCQPTEWRFLASFGSEVFGLRFSQWLANAARQRCTWQLTVAKAWNKKWG